jgi:hypothetical protein
MRDDDDDLGYRVKGTPFYWDGILTMIALVMTIIFTVMLYEDVPEAPVPVDATIYVIDQPSNYIDK